MTSCTRAFRGLFQKVLKNKMDPKAVYKYCKHLGCCEACCLRYMGIKTPSAYENVSAFVIKYQDEDLTLESTTEQNETIQDDSNTDSKENILDGSNSECTQNVNGNLSVDKDKKSEDDEMSSDLPPSKKRRIDVCASCLGVLQENNWEESYTSVKEVLLKKRYESKTFACALSAPMVTLLRERAISLRLADEFPGYDDKTVTPLKEAWKWSFGVKLAAAIDKTLDSGAVCPLLITLNYDYADELQELEILKQLSPQLFEERSKQKRRFVTEFTRRSVEQALESASLQSLQAAGGGLPDASVHALCIGVVCSHAPMYLAGRYIKLSRNLPQSPWILDGKRMLPSSVQEIIYKPLADFYNLDAEEADRKLKLIAAGREDVDVRCLGEGRPFAIEITDPTRQLTGEELARACEEISKSGEVIVKQMVPITREDLVQLKKGEETKSKTYEALCIKLSHSKYENVPPNTPITVTQEDIARINSFRNTPPSPNTSKNNPKITEHDLDRSKTITKSENIDDKGVCVDTIGISKAEKPDKSETENITEMETSLNGQEAENGDVRDTTDDATDTAEILKSESEIKLEEDDQNTDVLDTTDGEDGSGDTLDTSEELQQSENADNAEDVRITIQQKTPIRVLHRRPLLTRTRQILELKAHAVPEHPQLFRIVVRTSAGTYVKEWAHGELGRSRPALRDVLGARVDLLALDVAAVHLAWPPR